MELSIIHRFEYLLADTCGTFIIRGIIKKTGYLIFLVCYNVTSLIEGTITMRISYI